jgi:endonuclease/exonuclease/phosphatase (EEP) superfamily protein YafD
VLSRLRRFVDLGSLAALVLAALLLLLRFTVRDAYPLPAWIYYFFGLAPIIAALFALSAIAALAAGKARRALIAVLLAVSAAGGWLVSAWHDNPCEVVANSIRLVAWNISRLRGGAEKIVEDLQALDADLVLLVEAGNDNRQAREFWQGAFPDYEIALPGGGLAVLARGRLGPVRVGALEGISSYARVAATVGDSELEVLLVDLDASPRFDKHRMVPEVFRLAVEDVSDEDPLIVAGDFNTPIVSSVFRRVRERFTHAFEDSGSGLLLTWPARLPLTAIDHVWGNDGVRFLCTRLATNRASDHRAVVADLVPWRVVGSGLR